MSDKLTVNDVEITDDEVKLLIDTSSFAEVGNRLAGIDPADIADIFKDLSSKDLEVLFTVLSPEMASDVILEMEPEDVDDVVEALSPEQLADMIGEMAPDDAVDFYSDLETEEQNAVLLHIDEEDRTKIKELIDYEEDSAGGLMTSELCAVNAQSTVHQCLNLIAEADFSDPISTVFVVDSNKHLVGNIGISYLLAEGRNTLMKDVDRLDSHPVSSTTDEDQESIAHKFRRYDLYVMPVVDENNVLIGRITADDVMDVMLEEADEDLAHIAGAPDIEHHVESPVSIVGLRLPWLMITMCAGMIISVVVNGIIGLEGAKSLAAFVPVIMAMGGNTGMQASAVTIRSIALGQIQFDRLFSVFAREFMVGALMGGVCGVIAAIMVATNLHFFSSEVLVFSDIAMFSGVVSVSMWGAMTFAAFAGTILPILLHRFNIDPAVASGPFVTTGNDLSASLIYFVMCYLLLA